MYFPHPLKPNEAMSTPNEVPEDIKKSVDEMDALLHKYIGKMFGGVAKTSIEYFLQTGTINGMFRLNLCRLIYAAIGDTEKAYRERAIAFAEWVERKWEPQRFFSDNKSWKPKGDMTRTSEFKTLEELYDSPFQEYLQTIKTPEQ